MLVDGVGVAPVVLITVGVFDTALTDGAGVVVTEGVLPATADVVGDVLELATGVFPVVEPEQADSSSSSARRRGRSDRVMRGQLFRFITSLVRRLR